MTPRGAHPYRPLNDPPLRVVPDLAETGEIPTKGPQSMGQALAVIKRMEGELHGYRLRYDNLERELHNAQGQEPEAENVKVSLDYWARRAVEEGWWSQTPRFKPGDARWRAVRARQKEGRSPLDCNIASEGALLQDRRQTKREWVDAKSVFGTNENFERSFERAKDPMLDRVRSNILTLPRDLHRKDVERLLERCDCGHRFYHHHKQVWAAVGKYADDEVLGLFACDGCDCLHFETGLQRMREREKAA